jgi:hypothetical protein
VIAFIWTWVFVAAMLAAAVFRDNDPNTDEAAGFGALAVPVGIVLTLAYVLGGPLFHHFRRKRHADGRHH